MATLKKTIPKRTWEHRLCITAWLTPLVAFICLWLWNWFVLEIDGSHAYVSPEWWPWKNWSAVEVGYIAPQICGIVGINSIIFGLIRRYPSLIIAGGLNLLVSLFLHVGMAFE